MQGSKVKGGFDGAYSLDGKDFTFGDLGTEGAGGSNGGLGVCAG